MGRVRIVEGGRVYIFWVYDKKIVTPEIEGFDLRKHSALAVYHYHAGTFALLKLIEHVGLDELRFSTPGSADNENMLRSHLVRYLKRTGLIEELE